ncbi:conserved phage C-terminal domain-containing protein [Paucilactobacillus kaifaensis]|uniref:conserved phage C-terminal domain-containing protein n=1 Tax=Paucilactobacillus kaifaensis TaxID=2559921 RepID=UPI0010F9C686|nr:conserved phage C-terminal domain-containing protein [Paucilactobacillus kaifaensis]
MAKQGWIKIYRKITDSLVWSDPNLLKMWILCLTKASHETGSFNFNGKEILLHSGEFVTGRIAIGNEYNYGSPNRHQISADSAWRLLKKLKSMEMLHIKTTTKYSVVTVIKWDEYQETAQHTANTPPSNRQHSATYKNVENANKEHSLSGKPDSTKIDFEDFFNWFNKKTGRHFKNVKGNRTNINNRIKEGYTKADLAKVVEYKASQWKNDPEMNQFLRPSTLFIPSKFEGYLNDANSANNKHKKAESTVVDDIGNKEKQKEQADEATKKYLAAHPELQE